MRKMSDVIPNTDLKEIKVDELEKSQIAPYDNEAVTKLIKMLRNKFMKFLFIFSFFFIVVNYIQLSGNNQSNASPLAIFTAMLIFNITFSLAIIYFLKNLINLKNINSVKKAKYGSVLTKYYLVSSSGENNYENITYYLNVSFKEEGLYIRKVNCTKEIYESLEVGESVLVLSFDNKTAYCVATSKIYK